jgi:hypothetical protein
MSSYSPLNRFVYRDEIESLRMWGGVLYTRAGMATRTTQERQDPRSAVQTFSLPLRRRH